MFDEIMHDLNRKLAIKKIHVYDSFNFDDKKSREELKKYVNIAVFRINYGSLQLLNGNRGMTVEATLAFAFKVEDNVSSPAKMEEALEYLIDNNNGEIADTSDLYSTAQSAVEQPKTFRYVMTFEMYKPDGEFKAISYDDMPDRYAFYNLPVQIIISSDLMFGDDFKIYVRAKDNDENTYYVPIKNVVYWEEETTASFETPVFVNEGIQKNLFVARGWELKGKLILTNESRLIKTLIRNTHLFPDFVYTIFYEIGTLMYTAEAYFTMSNSGSVREFVVSDFAFHLNGDYRVLSDDEKEAVLLNIREE